MKGWKLRFPNPSDVEEEEMNFGMVFLVELCPCKTLIQVQTFSGCKCDLVGNRTFIGKLKSKLGWNLF